MSEKKDIPKAKNAEDLFSQIRDEVIDGEAISQQTSNQLLKETLKVSVKKMNEHRMIALQAEKVVRKLSPIVAEITKPEREQLAKEEADLRAKLAKIAESKAALGDTPFTATATTRATRSASSGNGNGEKMIDRIATYVKANPNASNSDITKALDIQPSGYVNNTIRQAKAMVGIKA